MSNTHHIIGVEISGLTLELELAKKRQDIRIYEKLKAVGGLTRTEIINDVSFDSAVVYLLSKVSSDMTGSDIVIDGGWKVW